MILSQSLFISNLIFCRNSAAAQDLYPGKAASDHSTDNRGQQDGLELVQKGHHERDEVDLFLILCAGGVSGLIFVHALLLRTKPIFMFVPFCAMHIL